jgi:hypothetical protein
MLVRFCAIGLAGLLTSGCANEQGPRVLGYQGSAPLITTASAAPIASDKQPIQRTMASKVLAAMALERVTGRKPDPARLAALD